MTHEEAINEIRSWDFLNGKELEAIQTLLPELRESEDKRIGKEIINYLDFAESHNLLRAADYEKKKGWIDWLEREKMPSVSLNPALGFDPGSAVVYHNDESEDEMVMKWIFEKVQGYVDSGIPCSDEIQMANKALAWLEKQKGNQYFVGYVKGYSEGQLNPKQKEIPMPNSTELIEMWHNEEAMLKEKGFRGDTWRSAYNAFLDGFAQGMMVKQKEQKKDNPLEDFSKGYNAGYYHGRTDNEQKPDIELIQRSWYMEGYHDRDFGMEPRWIIKTGDDGPKHELNPRYGQPLAKEQKPVEWKPQPESLEALMYAIEGKWEMIKPTSYLSRRLEDLYDGLVNTYNIDETFLDKLTKTAYTAKDIEELKVLKDKIEASMEQKPDIEICPHSIKSKSYLETGYPEQKPAEKQDYSGLTDLERAIHRGFLSAGVENVPVTIIKETAKDCLAHMPAEWSEEDKNKIDVIIRLVEQNSGWPDRAIREYVNWLKSLRPLPHWKPSEDEERLINTSISFLKDFADKGYENAVECIDWLKSKLNGNSCE